MGLEPISPNGEQILSLPCLPFHQVVFLKNEGNGIRTHDFWLDKPTL